MDDIVKQAMAKWPNVPACHGWLGLDDRGNWWMRDAQAQSAGPFQMRGEHEPAQRARGARLTHEKLVDFIGRNYACDEQGCWYFQNGPQRVFVELQRAPWACRVHAETPDSITLHNGVTAAVQTVWLDDEGAVYVHTRLGLALVHTQDMVVVADLIERNAWTVQECPAQELPKRFGFVISPQAMMSAPSP